MATESEGPLLQPSRIAASLDALNQRLREIIDETGDAGAREEANQISAAAAEGMDRLKKRGAAAVLSPAMEMAVEAIIVADGSRPSVCVQNDHIDLALPNLGRWTTEAGRRLARIQEVAQAVGRIEIEGTSLRLIGTGFAVRDGVIATNRHVLEAIAAQDPAVGGAGEWVLKAGVRIDFKGEADQEADPCRQFPIARVLFAGPDPIGEDAHPGKLDLALLALAPGAAATFPKPLAPAAPAVSPAHNAHLYVMGFPAQPPPGAESGRVLRQVFGRVYGVKRWAPGLVSSALGTVAGDVAPPRTFAHDTSTLLGSSGSCVIDLADGGSLVGLHFGGRQRVENYAHATACILAHL